MLDLKKPVTRQELAAAGYLLSGSAKCRGCGAAIEWWMTAKARRMPFNVLEDGHPRAALGELSSGTGVQGRETKEEALT